MKTKNYISMFLDFLLLEKGLSKNTFESYKNDLDEFNLFLLGKKIESIKKIDKQVIIDYYLFIGKKEYSKATLQRKYSALNQFFKYLIRQEKIKSNPMLSMRRQKKDLKLPKFLTEEEMHKLLSAKNPLLDEITQMKHRLILEMLYSTGMRVSEICNLPLTSVIFVKNDENLKYNDKIYDYKFITIKGKGQKERIVPLKADVIPLLKKYIILTSAKRQKYLFASNRSKSIHITRQRIGQIIKEMSILAGLNPERVSPHKIRHSFATHLLQRGLDIREIQELLGHSNIDTTAIYAKIDSKTSKNVVEKYHPLSKNNINR